MSLEQITLIDIDVIHLESGGVVTAELDGGVGDKLE
jgi:hypothetical protein